MFDGGNLIANFDCLTDDFVAYAEREIDLAPTTSDSMDIRAADAASLDDNIYVVLLERLGFVLDNAMRRVAENVREDAITSCFLKSLQFSWEETMKPSNVSG